MKHDPPHRDPERGAALVIAVVLLAVLGLFGTAYWQHLHFTLAHARASAKEQSAHALAESGLERAFAEVRAGNSAFAGAGPEKVGEGHFTVRATREADGAIALESTGALGDPGAALHACTLRARIPAGATHLEYAKEARDHAE